MKKSQVLAALALAFALGVVAPVASVVNSADTYAVDYDPTRQASYCDVMNAASAVRGLDAYKRYEKVYAQMYAFDNTDDKVYYQYTSTNVGTEAPVSVLSNASYTEAGVIAALQSTIATATGSAATSSNLSGLLQEAENIHFSNVNRGDFASYLALFDYMTTDDADLVGKEAAFRGVISGVSTFNGVNTWTPAQLKSYVMGNLANAGGVYWARSAEYKKLAPVIATYKNAKTYNQAVEDLASALQGLVGFGNVTLTSKDIKDAKDDTTDSLRELVALVAPKESAKLNGYVYFNAFANDGNDGSSFLSNGFNGYATLIYLTNYAAEHAQLKNGGINDANRDLIDRIGNAYESAVALVPGTASEFKTLMASYTGTCGNTNDGTGEGTNKPEDNNNGGNKAPDTGILADAEGSASTTVAMVAGVATALTAAGAGVVAYRNARRSTRK